MSKKIITNLLNYLLQEEAQRLVISQQEQQISLDCYLGSGQQSHLSLPKNLAKSFFSDLNEILAINAGKLVTKKYHKIKHYHKLLPIYLTVLPEKNKERIIIDLIKSSKKFWRLSQLGLNTEDLKTLKKILTHRSGLIIVNSPARGGKSTTLYALSALLNKPEASLYFLGEPSSELIPKIAPGINMLKSINNNWASLRQHDSDIILADNLTTKNDLSEALLTANTGRLIIITVRAEDAKTVIKKIKSLELPPRLIKQNLKMIISQKLIPLRSFNDKFSYADRRLIGQFYLLKL